MATRSDLGKWMITNGGDYDPEKTYEQLTMVMYNDSTYITMKTVRGVEPADDKVNYLLMAKGFNGKALSDMTAKDNYGALGPVGNTVSAQSLVDWISDQVINYVVKKSTLVNNALATVPGQAALDSVMGKTLQGEIDVLNSAKVTNNDSDQSIAIGWTNNVAPLLVNGAWKGNIAFKSDIEDAEKYKMTHNAAVLGLPPGYYYLYDDCTGLPESSGNFYGEIHMVDNLYKTVKLIPADVNKHYYYLAKSFYGSWTGWESYHQSNDGWYKLVDASTNINTDLVTANYSYGFKKSGIGVLYINFTCTPKSKGWLHVLNTGFRPRDTRNAYTHTSRNELVQLQLTTDGVLKMDTGNLTTGASCEVRYQIIMSVDD